MGVRSLRLPAGRAAQFGESRQRYIGGSDPDQNPIGAALLAWAAAVLHYTASASSRECPFTSAYSGVSARLGSLWAFARARFPAHASGPFQPLASAVVKGGGDAPTAARAEGGSAWPSGHASCSYGPCGTGDG